MLVIGHPDNFVECYAEKRQTATFKLSPKEIADGEVTVTVKNQAHITSTVSCGTPALEVAAERILEADLKRAYRSIYYPSNRLAFNVSGTTNVVDACAGQWDTMEFVAITQWMRDYMEDQKIRPTKFPEEGAA